jgi:hypothetical protein
MWYRKNNIYLLKYAFFHLACSWSIESELLTAVVKCNIFWYIKPYFPFLGNISTGSAYHLFSWWFLVLNLKIEAMCFSETSVDCPRLRGFIFQKIVRSECHAKYHPINHKMSYFKARRLNCVQLTILSSTTAHTDGVWICNCIWWTLTDRSYQ